MKREMEKVYSPQDVEGRIYKMWIEGGYFKGEIDHSKKPFTIVIPPPNITGQLHMGHALNNTMQDILIRTKRMQGYAALWIPGTDHASIATEAKIVEAMREEGITKEEAGRDEFLKRAWQWKEKYGGRIVEQLKRMGSSCDWSRERFTMDEGCSAAVREVFVSMFEKGLIYKGSRIINWCPNCTTAISDTEVEHEDKPGNLWHIKYPVKDSDEFLTVATTRPETMLGDTAVAVHPEDERYTHLIGKACILPLMNREIPIIADEYVDREFGTGCVKITPCHDPNDFEVGLRHDLEQVLVMDENARINENGGKYAGMDRYDARKAVVQDLEELVLLASIEEHSHSVGHCHRCNTTVEPITSEQWFVRMEPLARDAIEVVKDGTVKYVPDRFTKIYTHWMENVRDWCISRQLWWGHRIPAWYCSGCGHINVARHDPDRCEKCGSTNLTQDEGVLDTWFSSALWPFSTLGWPEKTEDLEYFYPTDVLVTMYDIIFFWVARMIFSGLEHTGKAPFHTVFIHGMVRDDKGRKMSKSLGNGIDPLEIIDKFGADALRFSLITGNSPGNDMRFSAERCEAMRNFANKIWNASRYVMMNVENPQYKLPLQLELEDKWILSKLNSLIGEVIENIDKYELGIAAGKIYDFIWDSYCDWYIELSKPRLSGGDAEARDRVERVLIYVLAETLKLLHPFMPFITEEIWQSLGIGGNALMVEKYPEHKKELEFPGEESSFEMIMAAIRAVRARRTEMNVPPSKRPALIIVTDKTDVFQAGSVYLSKLAYAGEVTITDTAPQDIKGMVTAVTDEARMFMPLAELVDVEKERERIGKSLDKAKKDLFAVESKLKNESFVSKAPENVVNAEREKADKIRSLIANLENSLAQLG